MKRFNRLTDESPYIDVKSRDSAEVIHIDTSALVPGKQTGMKFTIIMSEVLL